MILFLCCRKKRDLEMKKASKEAIISTEEIRSRTSRISYNKQGSDFDSTKHV